MSKSINEQLEDQQREQAADSHTFDERVIAEAVLHARHVQDFIFGDRTSQDRIFDRDQWSSLFQKRVDAITNLDLSNPSAIVELRKRILQQAALSIRALTVLDKGARLVVQKDGD